MVLISRKVLVEGLIMNHNWIDDSIIIDFNLPEPIRELINEIEEHDKNRDLGYYLSATEWLDSYAKRWIGDGLTRKQYDMLRYKYN